MNIKTKTLLSLTTLKSFTNTPIRHKFLWLNNDPNYITHQQKQQYTKHSDYFYNFHNQHNNTYNSQILKVKPENMFCIRTGLVGYKQGMTHLYDSWGMRFPVTVVLIDRCQVVQVKTKLMDGVDSMQVGVGQLPLNLTKRPQIGHFVKAGVPPKRDLVEFRISPENALPVGYMLSPRHFLPGQFVDVQGVSKGKGFQGTIQRWNFHHQTNTHGNSLSHRHPGSIGMSKPPGKVWKGKKMAGRGGGENSTVLNVQVFKVDCQKSLLYLKGPTPGNIHGRVIIRDAVKMAKQQYKKLSFPTFLPEEGEEMPRIELAPPSELDPFEQFINEAGVQMGKREESDDEDAMAEEPEDGLPEAP